MSINSDMFESCWRFTSFDLNVEKSHFQGPNSVEFEGCKKMGSDNNVVDSLPEDPFGMDIKSSRVTTIWFEDSDEDFGHSFNKFGIGETEENSVNDDLFVGLDWFVDSTVRLQPQKGNNFDFGSISIQDYCLMDYGAFDLRSCRGNCVEGKELHGKAGGTPHDGLFFALGYLGVKELLVVERVCKSLYDAVRGDPLLWKNIHIDQALSEKITDEGLVKLTSRAQGTLECLSLIGCYRITNNGLKTVLDSNPRLTKLSVPGCARLTIDGLLFNLRALKSAGSLRIKHLRIGGLFGVTEMQFEELKFLLGADNQMQERKPHFYREGELYLSCDDDCAIDIEMCPKCNKLRLIYDCPAESCQGNDQTRQSCRACTLCIARCSCCGRCINDCNYEETFFLDFLCLVCFKQFLSSKEKAKVKHTTSSSRYTIFHREMSYECCLYG